jgi:RNA polymerase sigma factor (sigma-70 family)
MSEPTAPPAARTALLYHFCRMQLPAVVLPFAKFTSHLTRTFHLFAAKSPGVTWSSYFDQLYALDWYLCCGCLENDNRAWEALFATRTGRSDCLLIDALRARAVRLYPRDEEKQEAAVTEFWSHLLVSETPGSVPVLARYDGQRPLAPWLIRVFQNWHVSQLRSHPGAQALPEDDIALPLPDKGEGEGRWHDSFVEAAQDWLGTLSEQEVLLLGLRWRYRLSQRDISHLFGVHEGTISRQTDKLRDRCLDRIGKRLTSEGWTGDDLEGFILTELGSLLMDDPKLSADQLTALLARRGKSLTPQPAGD